MTISDALLLSIRDLKLNLCRVFRKKTNDLRSDGRTTQVHLEASKVQLDWFQLTHGTSDGGAADKKGRT